MALPRTISWPTRGDGKRIQTAMPAASITAPASRGGASRHQDGAATDQETVIVHTAIAVAAAAPSAAEIIRGGTRLAATASAAN
ncbi:hypothetical protein GCM10022254_36020 [Actinomadura meridiana]|uniref:Uncharacterized protein n=1 Tax=Actinomadura meridiana TaxID=559626 RepID=A0ABP8C555_9ACTN